MKAVIQKLRQCPDTLISCEGERSEPPVCGFCAYLERESRNSVETTLQHRENTDKYILIASVLGPEATFVIGLLRGPGDVSEDGGAGISAHTPDHSVQGDDAGEFTSTRVAGPVQTS